MTIASLKNILAFLLLITSTIAVYAVSGSFDLLSTWDDWRYVTTNDTVSSFTLYHLKQAFGDFYLGNYAPLHILSYMIDHVLWGMHPAGYHLENVLLHLANGLLFYTLLRRFSLSEWQACAAAWIFLLHPLQVETVVWVSQRKSLLAMFFFLIALLSYQIYAEQRDNRTRWYLFSLAAIAAALLSKSIAVIFPAVLVLYDLTCDGNGPRSRSHRILDKIPFIAVAVAVAVMAMISQSLEEGGGRRDYPGGSALTAFYTMAPILLGYVRDCFWPLELSPYYMAPVRQQADAGFAVALVGLLLLLALGVYLFRTARPAAFWYIFFFIALVPVMQFVPLVTLKNDRYMYTPLLGFSVLVVFGARQLLALIPTWWRRPYYGAVVLAMLALPLFAFKQTLYWRDDLTLWKRAVAVDPENRVAWLMLAKIYTGRHDTGNSVLANNRYFELRNRYGPYRGFEKH